MARYSIAVSVTAQEELERLRAFDERRIVNAIRSQLSDQPDVETRNRKRLDEGLKTDFDVIPPLWELKVGSFRVFYGIIEAERVVNVYSVRLKPPHKTTQEVAHENDDD